MGLFDDPFGIGAALFGPTSNPQLSFGTTGPVGDTAMATGTPRDLSITRTDPNVGRSSQVEPFSPTGDVDFGDAGSLGDFAIEQLRATQAQIDANIATGVGTIGRAAVDVQPGVQSGIDALTALLSPVSQQFQDLASNPVINDQLRQQLRQSIIGSAQGAAERRNEVIAPFAARGLANSSLALRDVGQFNRDVGRGAVTDLAALETGVANINRTAQESALRGAAGVTGQQAALGAGFNQLGVQLPFQAGLAQGGIQAGSEVLGPFDITPFAAIAGNTEKLDFFKGLSDEQRANEFPDFIRDLLGPFAGGEILKIISDLFS